MKGFNGDNRADGATEHILPMFLSDSLAVICPRQSLCSPFLLKKGPVGVCDLGGLGSRNIVEVVFVP